MKMTKAKPAKAKSVTSKPVTDRKDGRTLGQIINDIKLLNDEWRLAEKPFDKEQDTLDQEYEKRSDEIHGRAVEATTSIRIRFGELLIEARPVVNSPSKKAWAFWLMHNCGRSISDAYACIKLAKADDPGEAWFAEKEKAAKRQRQHRADEYAKRTAKRLEDEAEKADQQLQGRLIAAGAKEEEEKEAARKAAEANPVTWVPPGLMKLASKQPAEGEPDPVKHKGLCFNSALELAQGAVKALTLADLQAFKVWFREYASADASTEAAA
jgi:hypothetical protein